MVTLVRTQLVSLGRWCSQEVDICSNRTSSYSIRSHLKASPRTFILTDTFLSSSSHRDPLLSAQRWNRNMSTKPSTIQIDIPITPAPSPSSSPSRTTARSRTSLTIPSTSDDITRGSKTSDMQTTKNKGPPLPNPPSPEIASLAQLLTDMKKASKGFANVLGSFETGAAKVANVGANVKASEEVRRLHSLTNFTLTFACHKDREAPQGARAAGGISHKRHRAGATAIAGESENSC